MGEWSPTKAATGPKPTSPASRVAKEQGLEECIVKGTQVDAMCKFASNMYKPSILTCVRRGLSRKRPSMPMEEVHAKAERITKKHHLAWEVAKKEKEHGQGDADQTQKEYGKAVTYQARKALTYQARKA